MALFGHFVNSLAESKFNIKNPTVMDALIAINYDSKNLIVEKGEDLVFRLNGQKVVIKGEEGVPPKIYVNGLLANLKTPIKDGDRITIVKGKRGQDATITAGELLKQQKGKAIFVNNSKVDQKYVIKNGDEIVIKEDLTSFAVTVNGKEVVLKGKDEYLFVDIFNFIDLKLDDNKVPEMKLNGRRASYTDILKPGDNIEIEM
jgi:molybdopterin converting factor small subunit